VPPCIAEEEPGRDPSGVYYQVRLKDLAQGIRLLVIVPCYRDSLSSDLEKLRLKPVLDASV
jgi:hypothetical protein